MPHNRRMNRVSAIQHVQVEMTYEELRDAFEDAFRLEYRMGKADEIRGKKLGYDEDVSRHGSAFYEFQITRDVEPGDAERLQFLKLLRGYSS